MTFFKIASLISNFVYNCLFITCLHQAQDSSLRVFIAQCLAWNDTQLISVEEINLYLVQVSIQASGFSPNPTSLLKLAL